MDWSALLTNIIVALFSAGGFWALLETSLKSRKKTKDKKLDKLIDDVKNIKTELESTTDLCRSYSRDRLNYLSEKYMKQGYVPKEDIISYTMLGNSYINSGGNTETKTKFEYVIEELEVK